MDKSSVSWTLEQWTWSAEVSKVSWTNGLFKTIFPLKLLHQLKALIPRRTAQSYVSQDLNNECAKMRLPSVKSKWHFWDHLPLKLYTDSKLCFLEEWLKALSPRIMAQSSVTKENHLKHCFPKTWKMNVQSQVFPSVTDKCPFQDHLPPKIIISTQSSVSEMTWAMNVKSFFPTVTNK